MKARANARLLGLPQIEQEYGLPYGLCYSLIKRGHLPSVQPPGIRRLYVDRRDLERLIESWKEQAS